MSSERSFRTMLSKLTGSRKTASTATNSDPPQSTVSQAETNEVVATRDLRQDAWDTVRQALSDFADVVQAEEPALDLTPLRDVS